VSEGNSDASTPQGRVQLYKTSCLIQIDNVVSMNGFVDDVSGLCFKLDVLHMVP
jgi:hypothetical protein